MEKLNDDDENKFETFCGKDFVKSTIPLVHTLDNFDSCVGDVMDREKPDESEFAAAALKELLHGLTSEHPLWDKMKCAAFILHLATRTKCFAAYYSTFYQIEEDVAVNELTWNSSEVSARMQSLLAHNFPIIKSEEIEEFEVMPDDLLESLNGENESFAVKQENSKKVKEELDEKHLEAKERLSSPTDFDQQEDDGDPSYDPGFDLPSEDHETKKTKSTPNKSSPTSPKKPSKKHHQNLVRCELCDQLISSQRFKRHMRSHTGEKPYACNLCDKRFTRSDKLTKHKRTHAGSLYECDLCNKDFLEEIDLKAHKLKQHEGIEKPFSCDTCGKSFSQKSGLKVHEETHKAPEYNSETNLFHCDECGKGFARRDHLITHKSIHEGVRRFCCEECGKSFVQKGDLTRHKVTHTKDKPYCCDVCGQGFTQLNNMKTHRLTHFVDKFSCDECGKTFRTKEAFENHSITHTEERPFSCDQCGKSYNMIGKLKAHMHTHADPADKAFTCNLCHKSFTTSVSLKHHGPRCTEEKRQKKLRDCHVCGKHFRRHSCLVRHMLVHGDNKPFACDLCDKTFVVKVSLEDHRNIHTGNKPHTCADCDKQFATRSQLFKHRKRTHLLKKDEELGAGAGWEKYESVGKGELERGGGGLGTSSPFGGGGDTGMLGHMRGVVPTSSSSGHQEQVKVEKEVY